MFQLNNHTKKREQSSGKMSESAKAFPGATASSSTRFSLLAQRSSPKSTELRSVKLLLLVLAGWGLQFIRSPFGAAGDGYLCIIVALAKLVAKCEKCYQEVSPERAGLVVTVVGTHPPTPFFWEEKKCLFLAPNGIVSCSGWGRAWPT